MEVRIVRVGEQRYVVDVATLDIADVYRTDGKPVDYNQADLLRAIFRARSITRRDL
jgi:hypothetical protein